MRKSRFTEAQIIGMIKEQEAGMPTAEVCRKHGLSQGTFYKFKAKYGGMEVSDAAKLKALEDEPYQPCTEYLFEVVPLSASLQKTLCRNCIFTVVRAPYAKRLNRDFRNNNWRRM